MDPKANKHPLTKFLFSRRFGITVTLVSLVLSPLLAKIWSEPDWFQRAKENQFGFALAIFLLAVFMANIFREIFGWIIPSPHKFYEDTSERLRSDLDATISSKNPNQYRSVWIHIPPTQNYPFREIDDRPDHTKTKIVSVFNLKGGVGKTTLTAKLGGWLSREENSKSVLLVDIDFQQSLSDFVLPGAAAAGIHSSSTRLFDKEPPLLNEIIQKLPGTLGTHVIPAHQSLEFVDASLQALLAYEHQESRFLFRRFFMNDDVLSQYNLIVFDCPPRLTNSTLNALAVSDYYVIPTLPNSLSRHAVSNTFKRVNALSKNGLSMPELAGVIMNRFDSSLVGHQSIKKGIKNGNDIDPALPVFETNVRHSKSVASFDVGEEQPGKPLPIIRDVYNEAQLFSPFGKEFMARIGI